MKMKCFGGETGVQTNYRAHHHGCWELHLILEGASQQYDVDNGQTVVLNAGEICLIGSNVSHRLLEAPDSAPIAKFGMQIVIPKNQAWISEEVFAALEKQPYQKWRASEILLDIVQYMIKNIDPSNAVDIQIFGHATAILMHELVNSLQQTYGVEQPMITTERVICSPGGKLCESVVDYMKAHLECIPSVKRLCSHFAISARQLSRYFHSYYGESCMKIWNRLRKNYAADLLRNSEYRIEEIAEKLGYSNMENFIRFFTREEGMSPARYRRDISADFKGKIH